MDKTFCYHCLSTVVPTIGNTYRIGTNKRVADLKCPKCKRLIRRERMDDKTIAHEQSLGV